MISFFCFLGRQGVECTFSRETLEDFRYADIRNFQRVLNVRYGHTFLGGRGVALDCNSVFKRIVSASMEIDEAWTSMDLGQFRRWASLRQSQIPVLVSVHLFIFVLLD